MLIVKIIDGRFRYYLERYIEVETKPRWNGLRSNGLLFTEAETRDILASLRYRYPKDTYTSERF